MVNSLTMVKSLCKVQYYKQQVTMAKKKASYSYVASKLPTNFYFGKWPWYEFYNTLLSVLI